MSKDKRHLVTGSKFGQPSSPKILKQFADRGGYALLESIGEGKTPEEKQIDGWGKWGVFQSLKEKTKVSIPTLYRIKAWFPTLSSTGISGGVWIRQEDCKQLKAACSDLEEAEKLLKRVQEYFDRSLVINLMKFQIRRELLGESIESLQLALKQQLEAGKKERSAMEKTLNDALGELHRGLINLRAVIFSAS